MLKRSPLDKVVSRRRRAPMRVTKPTRLTRSTRAEKTRDQPPIAKRRVASGVLEDLAARIRVCTQCPLCQSRTLAVPGEGKPNAPVMIIGEGPGSNEDKTGRPFVGNA